MNRMPGSNIWNTAWRNRPLVQQHAFWEVRNGESALFWKDSWQQLPPLDDMESLQPSQAYSTAKHFQIMLRTSGSQLKKDSPGDNGKPMQQTCKSGRILISNLGRSACIPGKSQPEKDRTSSVGVTPHQAPSRSRKPITCKETPRPRP
jgi:hypothetical protein